MQPDVLEFRVPMENNKTLLVWNIEPDRNAQHVHDMLAAVFSSFGLLHLLQLCPNAPLAPPGFYAVVKFYSAAQAAAAQRGTDGRTLFQRSPLKVRLSSRDTPRFLSNRPRLLSHTHCLQLANHYLGFNGWSSDIITLKELPGGEEQGAELEGAATGGSRGRSLKFGCLLRLSFPRHQRTSTASAVVEDSFTCTGPEDLLRRRSRLQRMAREQALVRAFSTVLLVILGDGQTMVEVTPPPDHHLPEHDQQLIQVNQLTVDSSGNGDGEAELDLTMWPTPSSDVTCFSK